jgi:hypothetical protein
MNRRILLVLIIILAVFSWTGIAFAQESDSEVIPLTLDVDEDGEDGEDDTEEGLVIEDDDDEEEDGEDEDGEEDGDETVPPEDTEEPTDEMDMDDEDMEEDDVDLGGLEPVEEEEETDVEDIQPEDIEMEEDMGQAEVMEVEPFTVDDALTRKVVRTETFTDEDNNTVVYHYNEDGNILEKVVYLCPPEDILEELFQKKLFKMSADFPGGIYTFRMPGYDEPIYYIEVNEEIEIEGVEEFEGEEEFLEEGVFDYFEEEVDVEEGLSEEDIEAAIYDEESDRPIYISQEDEGIVEEVDIEEFEQKERYFDEDDILVGPGNYVDTLDEKYTVYQPEQSYLDGIILRESMNYEVGRVTIIVSQDVIVNYEEETYVCDFKGSYDAYHYLDGVLVSKFEDRKGMKKVIKYDKDSGNKVLERVHHSQAGTTYDLQTVYVYDNGQIKERKEIFYMGEMAYTTLPDKPDTIFFFQVVVDYYNDGTIKSMEEILLLDLDETMKKAIMPVDFTMEDIELQERAKYAEIGVRKTYYDNWELVSQVEMYMFGGVREGDYGEHMEYKTGMALVRYYGPNGLLIREERYAGDKLYSTTVITFDEGGNLDRISYIDVHGNTYKFKEAGAFYNGDGEEVTMEEFEEIRPEYDFEYLTEEYTTEDEKVWLKGDDFYKNFQKYILGADAEEDEEVEEEYVEGDDDEDYSDDDDDDDDIEEGLEVD